VGEWRAATDRKCVSNDGSNHHPPHTCPLSGHHNRIICTPTTLPPMRPPFGRSMTRISFRNPGTWKNLSHLVKNSPNHVTRSRTKEPQAPLLSAAAATAEYTWFGPNRPTTVRNTPYSYGGCGRECSGLPKRGLAPCAVAFLTLNASVTPRIGSGGPILISPQVDMAARATGSLAIGRAAPIIR
jgi:hypothetical protein